MTERAAVSSDVDSIGARKGARERAAAAWIFPLFLPVRFRYDSLRLSRRTQVPGDFLEVGVSEMTQPGDSHPLSRSDSRGDRFPAATPRPTLLTRLVDDSLRCGIGLGDWVDRCLDLAPFDLDRPFYDLDEDDEQCFIGCVASGRYDLSFHLGCGENPFLTYADEPGIYFVLGLRPDPPSTQPAPTRSPSRVTARRPERDETRSRAAPPSRSWPGASARIRAAGPRAATWATSPPGTWSSPSRKR